MRDYIKLCRYQINDAPTCRSRIFFKESMRATMNAPGLKGVNLYSYQYLYRPICPRIRVCSLHDSKFQCACIWTNPCITTCRFLAYRTHLHDNASKYHWIAASSHPRFRSCLPRATKTPMHRCIEVGMHRRILRQGVNLSMSPSTEVSMDT